MSWGLKDEYTWSSELNFNTQMEVPAQFIIERNAIYWNMNVNTHAQTCWESWRGPSPVESERMEWPQPSSGQGDLGDEGGGDMRIHEIHTY